ncbi:MAG TPA: lipopolysaccharide biosynthesis protein [Pyrinomonadaceae bacterium]|jgi:PST family polysaccharide transporter|nr:lipopolysaccharide biosynthesis protein [Pyrinomonadaceae bacterium]
MKSREQISAEGSELAASERDASERFFRTDHLMDTIGGRTARGGVVTMASHGLKFAISIVATAVLARLLSPKDYGLIGMVAVATNFIVMFKDMGLELATVQKAEISARQISTLFWVNLSLSVGTMIVLMLLSPAVSWFYGDSRLTMITIVSATGFVIGGLTVQHEALLKRQMRFMALSAIALVAMVAGYVVGIAFAWYGFGYWSLVFSQLAVLTADAILVWLACGWRPGLPRRDTGVRSMLSFGGNITAYGTVNYFSKNADNLLIGKFWGAQPLGLYNKAAQLVGLPTDQVHEPVMAVAVPALSRLADDPERYRKAYLRIMEKVLMLVMPAVALLIVSSDWIISIVLGAQWREAGPILVFMSIAGLFQPIMNTAGSVLVTQGRGRHLFYWSLISAPLSILSIIAGLPWGATGVAASYSLTRVFVANPLMFWFVGRTGPVRTMDFYRLLAPFAAAATFGILASVAFRYFFKVGNPVLGIAVCFSLIAAANLIVLSLTTAGRAALLDIKNSVLLLRPVRAKAVLEAR